MRHNYKSSDTSSGVLSVHPFVVCHPFVVILLGGDLTVAGNGVLEDWDVSPIYAQMDQIYSAYTACDEFLDACGV